jgi:hypothetical protein
VRLTVRPAASHLELPVRPFASEDEHIGFHSPEILPAPAISRLEAEHHNWLVHRDLAMDESVLEVIKDEGVYRIDEIDLVIGDRTWETYTYQGSDFASVRGETRTERTFRRAGWAVRTTTRTILTCDAEAFHIAAELDAWEGECRIHSENWQRTIPRDCV